MTKLTSEQIVNKLERYARQHWDTMLYRYIFESLGDDPEKALAIVQARLRDLTTDLQGMDKFWLELVGE